MSGLPVGLQGLLAGPALFLLAALALGIQWLLERREEG